MGILNNEIEKAKEAIQRAGLYLPTPKDYEALAKTTANAYIDYPLFTHVCKNHVYKEDVVEALYYGMLKILTSSELAVSDSPECRSLAIWQAPGISGTPTLPFILSGSIFRLIKTAGINTVLKLIKYDDFAESLRKSITHLEDWHLSNLTVHKDCQQQGLGTALLKPMIEFCQENNRKICLETNRLENTVYYQKFGFKIVKNSTIPNSDIVHFSMVKDPE